MFVFSGCSILPLVVGHETHSLRPVDLSSEGRDRPSRGLVSRTFGPAGLGVTFLGVSHGRRLGRIPSVGQVTRAVIQPVFESRSSVGVCKGSVAWGGGGVEAVVWRRVDVVVRGEGIVDWRDVGGVVVRGDLVSSVLTLVEQWGGLVRRISPGVIWKMVEE